MKRIVFLLTTTLILSWAFSGLASGQSLSGPLDDPDEEVTKVVKKPVEEVTKVVKKPVEEATKVVEKPVEEATKVVEKPVEEATKVVDKVAKDVTETAKSPSGAAGSVGDKPKPAPAPGSAALPAQSKPSIGATGSSATNDKVARARATSGKASKRSGKGSKDTNRAKPPGDTEEVAAAGHTIEPAQVKGTQIIAPATEAEESEGSGLSVTGMQILTWLILASWLLGTGAAFVWRGRIRVRAARS